MLSKTRFNVHSKEPLREGLSTNLLFSLSCGRRCGSEGACQPEGSVLIWLLLHHVSRKCMSRQLMGRLQRPLSLLGQAISAGSVTGEYKACKCTQYC